MIGSFATHRAPSPSSPFIVPDPVCVDWVCEYSSVVARVLVDRVLLLDYHYSKVTYHK